MPGGRAERWHARAGPRARSTALLAASTFLAGDAALAAFGDGPVGIAIRRLGADQVAMLSALTGVVGFAVLSAIALIRARNRTEAENLALRRETGDLRSTADRAEALIDVGDDRLVAWDAPGETPTVAGRLPKIPGVPEERTAFLAFGTWLASDSAALLDRAVGRLRERGEPFTLSLRSQAGGYLEALGRTAGSRAVVRFRDLSGDRLSLAALQARHQEVRAEIDVLKAALDAAGLSAWVRDAEGRLRWVSRAYVAAVEAASPEDALSRGLELVGSADREAIRAAQLNADVAQRRVSTVAAGGRSLLDIADVAFAGLGGGGIALDRTEIEDARAALRRIVEFHNRTLDQLAAGVAIFGGDRRLRSSNAAYRSLFDLDAGFLDSGPEEGEILDRLRGRRKLPEQADFRSWKADLLASYRATETREQFWHLPDGQTLRVLSNPNPEGGVTRIYENVTERLDLESRYNALARLQGETLDHLSEAVAVFGSDGRLRLHNPSLAAIWDIAAERLGERPHIAEVIRLCRRLHDDPAPWERLTAVVAGFDESRSAAAGRMERSDGRVIDYATVPLPDGQTMVTFVDVTATVHVERALTERNEALEAADGLKNAFIHHVSYELRSPLTNIIGFTQLLADPKVGELNAKQREYTGYIMSSSGALLAIVNDILDLATLDAGIMELELGEVDVERTVEAAVEGVQDRLHDSHIALDTRIPPDIGSLIADEKRVRQILYNLISNAIAFSYAGGRITVSAERDGDMIAFSVTDDGAGMPASFIDSAFGRFESRSGAAGRGGAGLGLAIVKSFVELHGGAVAIHSAEGEGTTVTFRLPIRPAAVPAAAE